MDQQRAELASDITPGIVLGKKSWGKKSWGKKSWHDLMARAEAVRAYNDKLPEQVSKHRICENDTVSIRRKLVVNENLIPPGSLGTVILARNNGKLFDVRFFCLAGCYSTISAFDLQLVV